MSYIGNQFPDGAILFNGNISTTGAGSALNTTGYDGLVFQVEGSSWSGIITAEGSNDGTTWYPLLVTKLSELAIKTQIDINGNWTIKADTLYVRYNVTNLTGTVTLVVVGNNNVISTASDRLALAMDSANDTPLYVSLLPQNSGIQQDLNGGVILSDAPKLNQSYISVGNSIVIDTAGYASLQITTQSFTGTIYASNDGVSFSNFYGVPIAGASNGNLPQGTILASSSYTYPCSTRYIKLTAGTSGIVTWFLRQQPFQPFAGVGLNYINGTLPVTGGVAGTLGVGGPNTANTATTTNPLQMGAVDLQNIVRRLVTDQIGRLAVGNLISPTNIQAATFEANDPISLSSFANQYPINVQETSQFEGQSIVELLGQILLELKILNQQTYELPRIIAGQLNGNTTPSYVPQPQYGDEPMLLRQDSSLFINQM